MRVNDPHESATWVYEYDRGSNILSKKKYAYTAPGVTPSGTPVTYSYTYDNPYWKDMLTTFNGLGITSDAIGNPTAYNGWSLTWQAGRQLRYMANSVTRLWFNYDHAGLRTKKIKQVNNVNTLTY